MAVLLRRASRSGSALARHAGCRRSWPAWSPSLALIGFLTIDVLPPGIVSFTPHLITLLVLSLASQRLRMPKADGLVYRRGEQLVVRDRLGRAADGGPRRR